MPVKYLDFENGDDSKDGSTFANRWKTFASGATSARTAPGDEIRIMASPYETLMGSATWTYMSKLITLASAVTANISDCETAWTPAANVTASLDSATFKEGTKAVNLTTNASFTTGLIGYVRRIDEAADAGAHRYWRLRFTASVNNIDTAASEIEFRESAGGVDATSPSTTVIKSNELNNTQWAAINAFDNNNTTNWNSSNFAAPCFIGVDFGAGVTKNIKEVMLRSRTDYVGNAPLAWVVEYSDDNVTWNTSWTATATGWALAETRVFTKPTVATIPTDMSGYQQVSLSLYNSQAIADGATLSLRLCSDIAGATTVNTIPIPAISSTNCYTPITVDLGAALGSNIQSVALYADKTFASRTVLLDNILACKASSAPDSLSLTSVIGKAHNVAWAASTAYTVGDVRQPKQPNRTRFCYRCTTAGTTAATEPAWPQELGVTVADGSVVWTCHAYEETWYAIQSINGTSVRIDQWANTAGNAGRGYSGTTETVATYKREPIKMAINSFQQAQKAGTDAAPITYSGGWDRTSMSVMDGETWVTGQNGQQTGQVGMFYLPVGFLAVRNLNVVKANFGFMIGNANGYIDLQFCHANHNQNHGFYTNGPVAGGGIRSRGLVAANNNGQSFYQVNYGHQHITEGLTSWGNTGDGFRTESNWPIKIKINGASIKNNGGVPLFANHAAGNPPELNSVVTANNAGGAISAVSGLFANKCIFGEGDPSVSSGAGGNGNPDKYVYLQNYNQVANAHKLIGEGGIIASATDQLYTAGSIAWKFSPTSAVRHSFNPLKLSIAKIRCAANQVVSLTIPTRRDNANIKGQLVVLGGQIAGVPSDVAVDCQPTLNTWVVSNALTFTPTEDGVVEVLFRCWDGVGTTNNFWISARDLAVS